MSTEQMRSEYEKYMKENWSQFVDTRRVRNSDPDNQEYMSWDMSLGWRIWQASRAAGITVKEG